MTPVTHIVSGLAVATILNELGVTQIDIQPLLLSPLWVVIIGFVSVLPDINVIWSPLTKHHDDFTHYPLFWLIPSALIGSVEYVYTGQLQFVWLFMALIVVHMLLDTVAFSVGVTWLAPFSKKEFSFTNINKEVLEFSFKEKGKTYLKYTALKVEVVVLVASLLVLLVLR